MSEISPHRRTYPSMRMKMRGYSPMKIYPLTLLEKLSSQTTGITIGHHHAGTVGSRLKEDL